MAASCGWLESSLLDLNLSPGSRGRVELPQVVELIVVVVLAAEHVKLVVIDGRGHGGASFRLVGFH